MLRVRRGDAHVEGVKSPSEAADVRISAGRMPDAAWRMPKTSVSARGSACLAAAWMMSRTSLWPTVLGTGAQNKA